MNTIKFSNSVDELACTDMNDFTTFINKNLEYRHFIWRGHSDSSWLLEPTLDRLLKKMGKVGDNKIINEHLNGFKMAARGRRGTNPVSLKSENDWWALGQHNGLATPLLDWTRSPYVALFFAFQEIQPSTTGNRVVFGLSKRTVQSVSSKLSLAGKSKSEIVEFVEPLSDENPRLVNQNGLFTRCHSNNNLEEWVIKNIDHSDKRVRLYKINIPDIEREKILQSLNRMNINHLSLFPDLYGASKFVNFDLILKDY